MNETQQLLKDFLGEEKFFEMQKKFGGISIYVSRPGEDAVLHYYKKGLSPRMVAMQLNVTESFVYKVIKTYLKTS
ncbi:MAG: hypothetical protein KF872_06065 [Chitinophagales bacterium]|nr:hypothetical protein [Chitinophagales bacterium]